MAKAITTAAFSEEVLQSDIPVLVDFWASWCGPCKMLSPIVDALSNEVTNVKICKVNVDEEPGLAQKYRVMSIPTLMVFQNGEPVKTSVGLVSKEKILEMIS
ncbi:MAG: thioredoxin [Lachnospiraceae bacterium]|nr:thioredoxin [Lachnospiraceae bacterium]